METTKCTKCGGNSTLNPGHLILPQAVLVENQYKENGKTAFVFKVYICDECNHVDLDSIP